MTSLRQSSYGFSIPPRVAAIVVTYNSASDIQQCLLGLAEASTAVELRIVVVDNASTDQTVELVRRLNPDVEVLTNAENGGYARGNNQAIEHLQKEEVNYYLIVNPDMHLAPGFLDALLEVMEREKDIGLVSPHVLVRTPTGLCSQIAGFRSLWGMNLSHQSYGAYGDDLCLVDRLSGACMLIRAEVFEQVGLFDEAYFLYWEEIDLGVRAGRAGFLLAVCRTVEVYHHAKTHGGGTEARARQTYYIWRNQFRFAFKIWGRGLGSLFLARRFISLFREGWGFMRAGQTHLLRVGWAGLQAGIRGETGKGRYEFGAKT